LSMRGWPGRGSRSDKPVASQTNSGAPPTQAGERRYLCWRAHCALCGHPVPLPTPPTLPALLLCSCRCLRRTTCFLRRRGRVAVVRGLTAPFRLIRGCETPKVYQGVSATSFVKLAIPQPCERKRKLLTGLFPLFKRTSAALASWVSRGLRRAPGSDWQAVAALLQCRFVPAPGQHVRPQCFRRRVWPSSFPASPRFAGASSGGGLSPSLCLRVEAATSRVSPAPGGFFRP